MVLRGREEERGYIVLFRQGDPTSRARATANQRATGGADDVLLYVTEPYSRSLEAEMTVTLATIGNLYILYGGGGR